VSVAHRKNRRQAKGWWCIADLIAGLDAPVTVKCLLFFALRYTNSEKHYAWASQKRLAWEMGVERSTVQRAFAWAKKSKVLTVENVRTGKNPSETRNHYWLNVERMCELQRPFLQAHSEPNPIQIQTE
jgi:hypothetical protein